MASTDDCDLGVFIFLFESGVFNMELMAAALARDFGGLATRTLSSEALCFVGECDALRGVTFADTSVFIWPDFWALPVGVLCFIKSADGDNRAFGVAGLAVCLPSLGVAM